MQKQRKKGQNIVTELNVNKFLLVPNVSLGIFVVGETIGKYTMDYDYIIYEKEPDCESSWDFYTFGGFDGLTIYVDDFNIIENIFARQTCFYQGINLIGYNFNKFKALLNKEPDSEDFLAVICEDGESTENQHVYDFDGLQIWTRYNKIKTVICYNYIDLE